MIFPARWVGNELRGAWGGCVKMTPSIGDSTRRHGYIMMSFTIRSQA